MTTYYHGGYAGLRPGDKIEPAPPHVEDGCPICVARAQGRRYTVGEYRRWLMAQPNRQAALMVLKYLEGADDREPVDPPSKPNRVYITAHEGYARWYAARSRGDLYEVVPDSKIEESDEDHFPSWTLYLGDSVKRIHEIESDSIGLSVYSPPFPGMYAYTNSPHDMGNVEDIDTMMEQYAYLIPELLRVTMPGRMTCVHLCQLTAMKSRDGYIGLKDYRGKVIELHERLGWNFAGEVTIEKNPQIQATRNKERGLLFKSLATDSSMMRMALADYLIYFRKPGENQKPIQAGMSPKYNPTGGWITEQEWIEWASPVWFRQRAGIPGGIRETDVLNVQQARETDDERHLAPLQLGVIERAVKLWSAPGDTVLSPFAGIGSEGYVSLKLNRKFVGIELKEAYWRSAQANLQRAIHE